MDNASGHVYANIFRARGGAYDVVLGFGLQGWELEEEPETLVSVHMSWEHLKSMIPILQGLVDNYEREVSVIPHVGEKEEASQK